MYNKNFHENIKNITDESDRTSDNNGYTLIEILIALAIFSIGILGVASMQILSVNYNSYARRATTGTSWGVERMESLMTLPYDDANLSAALADNPHTDIRGDTAGEGDTEGIYTVSWNVTQDPVYDYKTINMTVTWSVRGTEKRIRLNYIKSEVI